MAFDEMDRKVKHMHDEIVQSFLADERAIGSDDASEDGGELRRQV